MRFLKQYLVNLHLLRKLRYWQNLEAQVYPPFEMDFPGGGNRVKDAGHVSFRLDQDRTAQLLGPVHYPYATNMNDILLFALGLAVHATFGVERFRVDLEGHGREEIVEGMDVSRTVGWFTSLFPVGLDMSYMDVGLQRQLIEVKETLRRIPNKGVGYGLAKYSGEAFVSGDPHMCFNYLGQFDDLTVDVPFRIINRQAGSSRDLNSRRWYPLEMLGVVSNHCLEISLDYSVNQYKEDTMKSFLDNFQQGLQEIIDLCLGIREREITPSDLGYKELSVAQLDSLFDD